MTKKPKYSRAQTLARTAIKSVQLADPCIILIKEGTGLANEAVIDHIVRSLNATDVRGLVAVVEDFDNLTVLAREEMAEYGWYYLDEGDGQSEIVLAEPGA